MSRFYLLVCGALIVTIPTMAQSQSGYLGPDPASSRDIKESYCKGFSDAMKIIQDNRMHYRRLLGQPEKSQAEVLRWIYARPWKDDATHRTAPRRLDTPPGEPQIGPPAIESIDLYLIPAFEGCSVGEDGQVNFKMLDRR